MSQFDDWFHLLPGNTTTGTGNRRQRKLQKLQQALTKITNIMQRRLQAEGARKRLTKRQKEDLIEDFLTAAFASSRHTLGFLTTPGSMTSTTTSAVEIDSKICYDIRGRDRACCNSAVACFDELQTSIDDIRQAENDFSLLTACRKVSQELKHDKDCVSRAVSRCDGPGRSLLLQRFDNRISKLYGQFYRHCTPDALYSTTTTTQATATTTTSQEPGVITNGSIWQPPSTKIPPPPVISDLPTGRPTVAGHFPTYGDGSGNTSPTSGSIAIIAGAIAGGIILVIVLLIALILWCRSRNKTYDSGTTVSSSAGIFFQKKPNMFSTDRPRPAHGKRGVKRQESSEYAEIDERFMNRGFQPNSVPPLPGDPPLPGYLRPISEGDYTDAQSTELILRPSSQVSPPGTPESLKGLGFSPPAFATTGQLKYGPILAANANGQLPLYPRNTLSPDSHRRLNFNTNDNKTNETVLSAESFDEDDYLAPSSNAGSVKARYITMEAVDTDPYERPNSARSSDNYDQIEHETDSKIAPEVALKKDSNGPHKHSAVKVLPSNPLPTPRKDSNVSVKSDTQGPVAKPRRTKLTNQETNDIEEINKNASKATGDTNDHTVVSARQSSASNTSSHHYFVLEPHLV